MQICHRRNDMPPHDDKFLFREAAGLVQDFIRNRHLADIVQEPAAGQNDLFGLWQLDVETENSWTNSFKQNREALIGMITAIHKYAFMPTIGFYSNLDQWQSITSGWINLLPAWVATASGSKQVAASYCLDSFNGGPVWLTQYTRYLDSSYNCLDLNINVLR